MSIFSKKTEILIPPYGQHWADELSMICKPDAPIANHRQCWENVYQAFRARLIDELTAEGRLMERM